MKIKTGYTSTRLPSPVITTRIMPAQPATWRLPHSFLKLILAGFILVALPLILALAYSAIAIDKLSVQSEQAVHQAEELAHDSHMLVEQNMDMEHSARTYLILGDKSLLEGYFHAHQQFESIITDLGTLPLNAGQKKMLVALSSDEQAIYQSISNKSTTNGSAPDFSGLFHLTQQFLETSDAPVEHEISAMQAMSRQARTMVFGLLSALIPIVIFLVSGFSYLITHPIRQIHEAINHIGQGDLSHAINIRGPKELKQIGERLDWMRQHLLALEAQKTIFLQQMSHELKTPLTSIREGADLMNENVLGALNEKQRHVAQIMLTNSMELQKRIEDLLNYSAIQTGKLSFVWQTFAVQKTLDAVLREHALTILNRKLIIRQSLPDVTLDGDEQKIRIIMDNLLSNAIKYSPPGANIDLRGTLPDPDHLQLEIVDEGPGIDPADVAHIFEPFYQGRTKPESHIRGTGLGLSITQEYVREHGGKIEVYPHQPHGTRFVLTLPLHRS